MPGGAFRQSEWNPRKIVSQIAVMQVIFYLVSSAIWLFIAMLTGRTFSADTLFSWEVAVEGADADEEDEARGAGGGRQESWVVGILAALAVAAVCGLTLVPVVGRAKQCWDFAATVYILHLLACSCYTRFPIGPGAGGWWARQVIAATVMSLIGEYFCMKYELREISVVALAGTGASKPSAGGSTGGGGGGGGGSVGSNSSTALQPTQGAETSWAGRLRMAWVSLPTGRATHPPSPAAGDNDDESESLLRSTASSPARLGRAKSRSRSSIGRSGSGLSVGTLQYSVDGRQHVAP